MGREGWGGESANDMCILRTGYFSVAVGPDAFVEETADFLLAAAADRERVDSGEGPASECWWWWCVLTIRVLC